MSVYSDKLAHIQVVINYQYSVAQMCTPEDTLAHYLGAPSIDDVVRHNKLITLVKTCFKVRRTSFLTTSNGLYNVVFQRTHTYNKTIFCEYICFQHSFKCLKENK